MTSHESQGRGVVAPRRNGRDRPDTRAGTAVVAAAALLAAASTVAPAQQHDDAGHRSGTVAFPISCTAPARAEFERAVVLLHHMTYPAAREGFESASRIDPTCAMAHWGIAMTLFQPLWPTRPSPAELRRGWDEVQRARTLGAPTERERLFVETAAAFFEEPTSADYWRRIARWTKATKTLHARFGQDPEASAFHALAELASAPADTVTLEHQERAAALLLDVYERNPDHPGAMHYLVHASDAPGRERASLDVVRRYQAAAPHNPHALHMPTHIYVRLGDWKAVEQGNRRAADAALQHPAGDGGRFVWDEFPHATEFLVYAYLQQGADDSAAAQIERLHATPRLEPTLKTAFNLASTRARYALERQDWRAAMSLESPDPASLGGRRFAWPEAVTWFARGLGAARLGDVGRARTATGRLDSLESAARGAGEVLFARNIRILRLGVDAWLAHAEHDTARSVSLMREAADLELATPKHAVTPAPTIPALELLADLLMEQGRPSDALAAYERSLELHPRRFGGLLGAARAARASADGARAERHYRELLEVGEGSTRTSVLDEARAFVAARAARGD
jgi:tetratricopeptide (TPR) repeat protein